MQPFILRFSYNLCDSSHKTIIEPFGFTSFEKMTIEMTDNMTLVMWSLSRLNVHTKTLYYCKCTSSCNELLLRCGMKKKRYRLTIYTFDTPLYFCLFERSGGWWEWHWATVSTPGPHQWLGDQDHSTTTTTTAEEEALALGGARGLIELFTLQWVIYQREKWTVFNILTKQDASCDKENQLFLIQGKHKDLPNVWCAPSPYEYQVYIGHIYNLGRNEHIYQKYNISSD